MYQTSAKLLLAISLIGTILASGATAATLKPITKAIDTEIKPQKLSLLKNTFKISKETKKDTEGNIVTLQTTKNQKGIITHQTERYDLFRGEKVDLIKSTKPYKNGKLEGLVMEYFYEKDFLNRQPFVFSTVRKTPYQNGVIQGFVSMERYMPSSLDTPVSISLHQYKNGQKTGHSIEQSGIEKGLGPMSEEITSVDSKGEHVVTKVDYSYDSLTQTRVPNLQSIQSHDMELSMLYDQNGAYVKHAYLKKIDGKPFSGDRVYGYWESVPQENSHPRMIWVEQLTHFDNGEQKAMTETRRIGGPNGEEVVEK